MKVYGRSAARLWRRGRCVTAATAADKKIFVKRVAVPIFVMLVLRGEGEQVKRCEADKG